MDIILYIFFFCMFGALALMFVAAFVSKTNIEKRKNAEEKLIEIKKELAANAISQYILLNSRAKKGWIYKHDYITHLVRIITQLKDAGVDASILASIPYENLPDKKEMVYRILNIANQLSDMDLMGKEEYEENINNALDELNRK